jgi:hypothetical protein
MVVVVVVVAAFPVVVVVVGVWAPVVPVVVVCVVAIVGAWVVGLEYIPSDLFLFFCCPGAPVIPVVFIFLGAIVSDSSFSAVVPVVTALHLSLFLFFMAIRFSNCPSSRGLRYLREE